MRGVDTYLQSLEPVAFDQTLKGKRVRVRRNKAIELGKRGRLTFTQIGKNNTAALDHGIRALLDMFVHGAVFRFRRRFQTGPLYVKQPTVKWAAQAAVFNAAKCQVGTAMRTIAIHQPQFAVLVAKQNKILPH